jgi:general secretion pathway protein G
MRSSGTIFCLLFVLFGIAFFLVVPRVGSSTSGNARTIAAQVDVHVGINTALDQYRTDNGRFPNQMQDLVQEPASVTNWNGPYLERLPVDPWGNSYVYVYPGKHLGVPYDLFSAGPDGKVGTADDIVNWQ